MLPYNYISVLCNALEELVTLLTLMLSVKLPTSLLSASCRAVVQSVWALKQLADLIPVSVQ